MIETGKLAPVERETLQEQIYRQLVQALISGDFAPNTNLTYRSLAGQLGTSIMPVREALQRLAAEGVLVVGPGNRSLRVPSMSLESLKELYQIRKRLESLAAQMATPKMSNSAIENLERLADKMEVLSAEGDVAQFLRTNREFHFLIYEASESDHLLPIIKSLWLKFGPFLGETFREPSAISTSRITGHETHRAIVEAIKKRDAKAAERALYKDLETSEKWYTR